MIIKNCPICKKEFKTQPSRIKEGRGKFCSLKCSSINRTTFLRGTRNPCWRGGKVQRSGYWFIYKPEHPHAVNGRYVPEHRYIMEQKLGRYLTLKEHVHHINHIKTDNRPENLQLMGESAHHSHHSSGKNNPMYGIVRDNGLGKLLVKMPLETITKYQEGSFVNIPFRIIQKYINNNREIPWKGSTK